SIQKMGRSLSLLRPRPAGLDVERGDSSRTGRAGSLACTLWRRITPGCEDALSSRHPTWCSQLAAQPAVFRQVGLSPLRKVVGTTNFLSAGHTGVGSACTVHRKHQIRTDGLESPGRKLRPNRRAVTK